MDHNIVVAHVQLLGRCTCNRPVRSVKKPPIDRRRLSTDPHFREEVARAIGDRLQATSLRGSSVEEVEAAFTVATYLRANCAAARVQDAGARVEGDAQTEAEFSLIKAARCAAWRRLRVDSQGSQAGRDVWRAHREVKRVRDAAFGRFLERHVQKLE